jgi:hypothetical protein
MNSILFLDEVALALEAQIEEELTTLSAPVGEGNLDPVQWCLDTSSTRCIPISICVQHLQNHYGIDVAGLSGLDTKPMIH